MLSIPNWWHRLRPCFTYLWIYPLQVYPILIIFFPRVNSVITYFIVRIYLYNKKPLICASDERVWEVSLFFLIFLKILTSSWINFYTSPSCYLLGQCHWLLKTLPSAISRGLCNCNFVLVSSENYMLLLIFSFQNDSMRHLYMVEEVHPSTPKKILNNLLCWIRKIGWSRNINMYCKFLYNNWNSICVFLTTSKVMISLGGISSYSPKIIN